MIKYCSGSRIKQVWLPPPITWEGGGADEYIPGNIVNDRVWSVRSDADLLEYSLDKGNKRDKKIITLPATQSD